MIGSVPASNVTNDQPAGIGRVVALREGCAWNNLGRNVVFADERLRPQAIFGDTEFPEDPVASEYDLDVHAVVDLGDTELVGVLNHLGTLRLFRRRAGRPGRVSGPDLHEDRRLRFVADVERVTTVGDRLVTSRPRGDRLPGLSVTQRIGAARDDLDAAETEETFGVVTALAARTTGPDSGWVVLGGEGRLRLAELQGGCAGTVRWDTELPFLAAVVVPDGDGVWVAGSELGGTDLDDYDWERLVGGGLARLDLASGDVLATARFGADLAWGSGGVPFVVAGGVPCGIDRRGGLHALAPGEAVTTPVTRPVAEAPLGIAHATVIGAQVVFGFNRGGYRLHTVPWSRISAGLAPPKRRRA